MPSFWFIVLLALLVCVPLAVAAECKRPPQ